MFTTPERVGTVALSKAMVLETQRLRRWKELEFSCWWKSIVFFFHTFRGYSVWPSALMGLS